MLSHMVMEVLILLTFSYLYIGGEFENILSMANISKVLYLVMSYKIVIFCKA